MSHTVFVDGVTLTAASWFNDIDTVAYTYLGNGTNLNAPTKIAVTQGVFSTSVLTPDLGVGASGTTLTLSSGPSNDILLRTRDADTTLRTQVIVDFISAVDQPLTIRGGNGTAPTVLGSTSGLILDSNSAAGSIFLKTNSGTEQVRISPTASAVNLFQLTGAATLGNPSILTIGSDTDISASYLTKGIGSHNFYTRGSGTSLLQFQIADVANADRYIIAKGNDSTAGSQVPSIRANAGGRVGVQIGAGTEDAYIGGVLLLAGSTVGNVGAGPDQLLFETLVANSLSRDGQGVRITGWGTFANNANAKQLELYFGSANIVQHTATISTDRRWKVVAIIVRTSSNNQRYMAEVFSFNAGGGAADHTLGMGDITETDTASILIQFQATIATSNNDIVQQGILIEILN